MAPEKDVYKVDPRHLKTSSPTNRRAMTQHMSFSEAKARSGRIGGDQSDIRVRGTEIREHEFAYYG